MASFETLNLHLKFNYYGYSDIDIRENDIIEGPR